MKTFQSVPLLRFALKRECRICGSPMDRIKRKKWHRMLSTIIPVIHVECCNRRYLLFYRGANKKHAPEQLETNSNPRQT